MVFVADVITVCAVPKVSAIPRCSWEGCIVWVVVRLAGGMNCIGWASRKGNAGVSGAAIPVDCGASLRVVGADSPNGAAIPVNCGARLRVVGADTV